MHGWLLVDKPVGISSNAVLSKIKRHLGKLKLGHTGTLDPLASGLLLIAVGEATKLCQYAVLDDKTYEFTVTFGYATSTDDAEGEIINTKQVPDNLYACLEKLLPQFTGPISQTPPAFSAIKIAGERAYSLARQGKEVSMEKRTVNVYELGLLNVSTPEAEFRASVSKGTYIRSLGRDIALAAGSCGYISKLRRSSLGKFTIMQAIPLAKLVEMSYKEVCSSLLLPVDIILDDILDYQLSEFEERELRYGRVIKAPSVIHTDYGFIKAKRLGRLVALLKPEGKEASTILHPIKVFNIGVNDVD